MGKRVLWMTRTAVFTALLVVLQGVTRPLGQYVTGSCVNLVLILAVMLGGLWCGAAVAAFSPWLAFLAGIGPALLPVIPVMMLGNLALVLCWHFIAGRGQENKTAKNLAALALGAAAKFAVLYGGIVLVVVPAFLQPGTPQAAMLRAAFSFPQLVTAGAGGAAGTALLPLLRRAVKKPA